MESAPRPTSEPSRLANLLSYEILDTDAEAAFDDLTELASAICNTPISLISLIDEHRQWFKSRVGLEATETERSIAFCSHAILQEQVFEVPNTTQDSRFHDNPLVTGTPDIRFYAGAPLITPQGNAIGTLCVIDREPKHLSPEQKRALEVLSRQVIAQLELRQHNRRLERLAREQQSLFAAISHDLRSPFGAVLGLARLLSEKARQASPDKIASITNSILSGAMQVYGLLDEMLQWSAQRYNHKQATLSQHNFVTLLRGSHELLQEALATKGITLVDEVPPELSMMCDPVLTKSIIRNLLNNAIKFSPVGAQIRVAARESNRHIEFSVADQGAGIAPEKRAHLFGDVQTSSAGTSGEQGHGLGLRLCGELVAAQGGKIWLDTDYSHGTRIVVQLSAAIT